MRVKVLPGRADASAQAPPTPTPGAALRQRWTPSTDPAASLAALRADLETVVPGLAASVRTGLLAKDLARPAAERGPLNRVLCTMEHVYCAGNAGFLWTPTADDLGTVLGVLVEAGLVRRRLDEPRWHLTAKGASVARLLWERPEPTPLWSQAILVWPRAEVSHA